MSQSLPSSRRRFLQVSAASAAGVVLPRWTFAKGAPAIITSDAERPQALQGLQFGDPSNGSVIVWSRSDRPARMLVDPNTLDGTFGPQVVFVKAPPPGQANLSPYSGLQFFGEVNIDAYSAVMTVDLRNINDVSVFSRKLIPRNW